MLLPSCAQHMPAVVCIKAPFCAIFTIPPGMAKIARSNLLILPEREPGEAAWLWLYRAVREEVLSGRLRAGARLPSTRELASAYSLSRSTIVRAFETLVAEGYLEGAVGTGTFVTQSLPDDLLQTPRSVAAGAAVERHRRLSRYATRLRGAEQNATAIKPFFANVPAFDLFPFDLWGKIASRHARALDARTLEGCGPQGIQPLREAVADYLTSWRGVRCEPEQVFIVSGVLEALDLCARVFLDPGDRVCIEDPGYPDARHALEAAGAQIVPVPIDVEGAKIGDGALEGVRLIYVTPAHQAPLGVTMTLQRRMTLLRAARDAGTVIFEDDYDSEYRFVGRPVPALQGLDEHNTVIFSGSFSKVLFQGLRLGYVVLPNDLLDVFAAARAQTVRHCQMLDQLTLCDFINTGHFARHIRKMREIYAERLAALRSELRRNLDGVLDLSVVEAGLQVIAHVKGVDADALVSQAAREGVTIASLRRYTLKEPAPNAIILGFAAYDRTNIYRGVAALTRAVRSLT
ncbi:MAG TPA: PLP-dependent aminotransferase family protein [Candidatus Acidoferrales bacterium]|nr:PLP-dependent aminotransferase family protein [Candidatus Acidoferrales bacterium]